MTAAPAPAPLDFDAFVGWIGDRLGLGGELVAIRADSRLDDLGLDSLQRAELWVACEELGMDLPEELFAVIATFGDLFYYCEVKVGGAPP